MAEPHVVILGAGPAGVGAAFQLRRSGRARVTVIEQRDVVGGNAGSFAWAGQRLDYGSHRLHPACDPRILADIKALLRDDLLDRPRHGRIRLRGRWIHFPLRPLDLVRLDREFALGIVRDIGSKALRRRRSSGDTFASVLSANLGATICRDFYFPYARKIWGREPEELSGVQARRRVSAGSFAKLARKLVSQIPGFKPPGAGRFYYPRQGYGQITEAFADAARERGAEFQLGWRLADLSHDNNMRLWRVAVERDHETKVLTADYVWSTIPITALAHAVKQPQVPEDVIDAARQIDYRAMLLVFLQLDTDRFTEYDAHYFPDASLAITRLSEPKNYSALSEPLNRTVICAELPCSPGDSYWNMTDQDLANVVAADLEQAGIGLARPPVDVLVRRLRHAYPVYLNGYERPFGILDGWAEGLPRLLTFGRQGLFAHDNTHHALFMAYCAGECLVDGVFDHIQWGRYREVFASHVVED